MSGNVWEWCRDWYGVDYYASSPRTNPKGPSSGARRVLCGGGWISSATGCRVANRFGNDPTYRSDDDGFGVALS